MFFRVFLMCNLTHYTTTTSSKVELDTCSEQTIQLLLYIYRLQLQELCHQTIYYNKHPAQSDDFTHTPRIPIEINIKELNIPRSKIYAPLLFLTQPIGENLPFHLHIDTLLIPLATIRKVQFSPPRN